MLDSLPHMHTMCKAEGFMNTFVQLHTTTMALPLHSAKFSYPDTVTSNPVSSFAQLQVRLALSLVACFYHIQQLNCRWGWLSLWLHAAVTYSNRPSPTVDTINAWAGVFLASGTLWQGQETNLLYSTDCKIGRVVPTVAKYVTTSIVASEAVIISFPRSCKKVITHSKYTKHSSGANGHLVRIELT